MRQYTVGTLIRLSAKISTAAGALADPTTTVCKVKAPDGTVAQPSVTRDSQGMFHADFLPTILGLHMHEFIATGAVQATAVGQFMVTQTTF